MYGGGFGISGTASIIIGREIGAGRSDTVYQVGLALNTLAAAGGTILGAGLLAFTHLSAPAWFFPLFHLSPRPVRRHHYDDGPGLHHAHAGL